jgi:hypothetical protein
MKITPAGGSVLLTGKGKEFIRMALAELEIYSGDNQFRDVFLKDFYSFF